MRRPGTILVTLISMIGVAGCGDDESAVSPSPCDVAASKLRGCGLLSAGEYGCFGRGPLGPRATGQESCEVNCYSAASCSDLEASFCTQSSFNALDTCLTDCTMFRCQDGQRISYFSQCNGVPNCADGSDEQGCQFFTCSNGENIAASGKCDGFRECLDGSDELGCPAFTCADGTTVSVNARCNGISQCPDGSDEDGCPTFRCNNGDTISAAGKCNGLVQCSDGSDELGCPEPAQLTCPP